MRSFLSALVNAFDGTNKDQRLAGSAQSRSSSGGSTSAGSSNAPSAKDSDYAASSVSAFQPGGKEEIPDYSYPVKFTVKNTFIDDIDMWRPSSLDGFLRERQIQSCVSRINATSDWEPVKSLDPLATAVVRNNDACADPMPTFRIDNDDTLYCPKLVDVPGSVNYTGNLPWGGVEHVPGSSQNSEQHMWQQPRQLDNYGASNYGSEQLMWQQSLQLTHLSGEQSMWQLTQPAQYPQLSILLPPPPPAQAPVLSPELQGCVVPPPPQPPPPAQAPVLRPELQGCAVPPPQSPVLYLSDALPEPEVGFSEFPTKGSVGHHIGNCKPCAFFHTKGCAAGPECEFCHLCDPSERKRRRKEKLAIVREMRTLN